MNATSTQTEVPDELDRLFSDFFKAQLKHPWPKAPVPGTNTLSSSEPSELVLNRAREPQRNAAAPVARLGRQDSTARARLTLAASVVLALGACWVLSNSFQSNDQPAHGPAPAIRGMLSGSSADGNTHEPLKIIQGNKAKGNTGGNGGNDGNKMDPVKFD